MSCFTNEWRPATVARTTHDKCEPGLPYFHTMVTHNSAQCRYGHYGHYAVPCWSRSGHSDCCKHFPTNCGNLSSHRSTFYLYDRHVQLSILKRNLQTCCENCAFVDGMSHHQTLFIMSASMLHMLE